MLSIRDTMESGIRVVSLEGEWDLFERPVVEGHLSRLQEESLDGLVVDLSNVKYMDSSSIEVLIVRCVDLRCAGVPMAVTANDNNYVLRKLNRLGLFEGTGLALFDTVTDAVAALLDKE